ncbi:MAG TPA: cyd operon YbgE family protein [Gammaproteobacteria bacterium]
MISLILASALSIVLLIFPLTIAAAVDEIDHTMLSLLMWGCAIGFIHGVGFVPHLPHWRLLLHPVLGWLLMVPGTLLLTWQG